MFFRISTVVLLSGLVAAFNYEGYKVYDVKPKNSQEADFLFDISTQPGYDALHMARLVGTSAHIMVAPQQQSDFESMLIAKGMEFTLVVADVARKLKEDNIEKQSIRPRSSRIGFTQYYRHDDINAYLDELQRAHPKFVSVETVGKSYEGRLLRTIRITNGDGNPNKKVIFVDAGIHAREWIAPAAALYMINQLVENRDANQGLLAKFDWLILPVVNPDGYEYSHTNTRMWRKTRSKGTLCFGTDGNRNFDFHWGEVGSSASGCSDIFHGKTSFSEPETQAVRDLLLSLKGKGVLYLTLHSHGRYILYPWGWTDALPETYKDLDEVAFAGYSAILNATGYKYSYGTSTRVLYAAAGGSDDYAYELGKFPISITWELPSGGGAGFDPPPSMIQDFVTETWIGVKAVVEKVEQKYT